MAKIIFNEAGLDGKAAAVIARSFYPGSEMIGATYGRPIALNLDGLSDETVIMLGFALDVETMKTIKEKADNFIWIDHKRTSAEIAEAVQAQGIVREGTGSCQLAWEYFHSKDNKQVPLAIWLLARHVVWELKDPRVEPFQYGARLFLDDINSVMWEGVLENSETVYNTISAAGDYIYRYEEIQNGAYAREFAIPVKLVGEEDEYEVLAINKGLANAKVFGEVDWNRYDMVMTYALNRDGKWVIRLFSEKLDMNCAKLATEYGGGGSKGAAGFISDHLPFTIPGLTEFVKNYHEVDEKTNEKLSAITSEGERNENTWSIKGKINIANQPETELSASEAVYGFAAHHTTRMQPLIMGATHDSAVVAEAVDKFCKLNNLTPPRDNWTDYLVVSYDDLSTQAELLQAPKISSATGADGPDAPVMTADGGDVVSDFPRPTIAISFTLKNQGWEDEILPHLEALAAENPEAILVHGFLPRAEVVKRGFPTTVVDALDRLFPRQVFAWADGDANIWRKNMVESVKNFHGTAYIIGAVTEGVAEESVMYYEEGVPVEYRATVPSESFAQPRNQTITSKPGDEPGIKAPSFLGADGPLRKPEVSGNQREWNKRSGTKRKTPSAAKPSNNKGSKAAKTTSSKAPAGPKGVSKEISQKKKK